LGIHLILLGVGAFLLVLKVSKIWPKVMTCIFMLLRVSIKQLLEQKCSKEPKKIGWNS
jgi:hypothetical protein